MPLFKKSKKPVDMQEDMESVDAPKKDMKLAFDIQSRNKKKKMMAKGGPVSAKDESRPSAQELHNDSKNVSENEGMKAQDIEATDESKADIDLKPTKEELDMLRTRRLKMAEGGWVDGYDMSADDQDHDRDMDMIDGPTSHGQEIGADDEDERPGSIVAAIMSKRKKFADGGMVDLDDNAIESGSTMSDMNFSALKKENYSEKSGLDDLDYDTSESKDDDIESDKHDMVSSIRSKMKSKR